MRYEVCTTLEATTACAGLLSENWEEAGQPGTDELHIDRTIYEALADSDSFAILAKDGDELIGYAVIFLSRAPHTCRIVASNDTLYVRPDYRPRGVGGRLFYMAEAEARRRGAERFQWACNVDSQLHRALEKRAYVMKQVVIEREL